MLLGNCIEGCERDWSRHYGSCSTHSTISNKRKLCNP